MRHGASKCVKFVLGCLDSDKCEQNRNENPHENAAHGCAMVPAGANLLMCAAFGGQANQDSVKAWRGFARTATGNATRGRMDSAPSAVLASAGMNAGRRVRRQNNNLR